MRVQLGKDFPLEESLLWIMDFFMDQFWLETTARGKITYRIKITVMKFGLNIKKT